MFAKSVILAGLLSSLAVNALPQYGSSGNSGCSSGDCGSASSSMGSMGSMGESSCSSGNCGSESSVSSMESSGCGSSGCGSESSSVMSMESGCGSSGCGSESTMMVDSSSTVMMDSSSTMMVESTSTTQAYLSTSTSEAAMTYSTPSYGSGGMSWGSSGYDGCVQQCIASFGSAGSYQPTATSGSSGSSGSGSTITVIVAPTQGVLRYIPFAVNASVGDTIKFMWGANNHTVTKSSELTPCNKTSDAPFASGTQNQDFVFTQVVNDTNPTFFYCGTPTHCEKGMFGIINPPSAFQAPTSVSGMMSSVMSNNSDVATYAAYTANVTANSKGSNWGANIDMASMPSWAYDAVVENVMFTRNVLAMNPDIMNGDGTVNLNAIGTNPMMVPPDVGSALAASSSTGSSSSSPAPAGSSTASTASASQSAVGAASNGAMSVVSSKVLVGATVLVATFFAL